MTMKIISEGALKRIQDALEQLYKLSFAYDDIEDFSAATTAIAIIENELNVKRGGKSK